MSNKASKTTRKEVLFADVKGCNSFMSEFKTSRKDPYIVVL